jgi:hypothetical protein
MAKIFELTKLLKPEIVSFSQLMNEILQTRVEGFDGQLGDLYAESFLDFFDRNANVYHEILLSIKKSYKKKDAYAAYRNTIMNNLLGRRFKIEITFNLISENNSTFLYRGRRELSYFFSVFWYIF